MPIEIPETLKNMTLTAPICINNAAVSKLSVPKSIQRIGFAMKPKPKAEGMLIINTVFTAMLAFFLTISTSFLAIEAAILGMEAAAKAEAMDIGNVRMSLYLDSRSPYILETTSGL